MVSISNRKRLHRPRVGGATIGHYKRGNCDLFAFFPLPSGPAGRAAAGKKRNGLASNGL